MKIIMNHIGFAPNSYKQAILCSHGVHTFDRFQIIKCSDNHVAYSGDISPAGSVKGWQNGLFSTIDFSPVRDEGRYTLRLTSSLNSKDVLTDTFEIGTNIIGETIVDVMSYFKKQRCSGEYELADTNLPICGEKRTVDVHGGWYDASGDVSKYLSHLSYANFMNPQQIPLVVWEMLECVDILEIHKSEKSPITNTKFIEQLVDEALFGADFLVRSLDNSGALFMTIFDQWTGDPAKRMICEYVGQHGEKHSTWQAGMRQGGGMAIAALAKASRINKARDYTSGDYLQTAITAWDHLETNNLQYLNDSKENIIDDYCGLLAAIELYTSTKKPRYFVAATQRAERLIGRISRDNNFTGWLLADDDARTFYHGADAGLPVVALLTFHDRIEDVDLKKRIIESVKDIMQFELDVTGEVNNPFGYPRQYITELDGTRRSSFFIPQKNETGYWWQGENARLASLAAAARMTAKHMEPEMRVKLKKYAVRCIDWILGANPFDACMLYGRGANNPEYEVGFPSTPGGICNGITSGFLDENGIDLNPDVEAALGDDQRWRWAEQWIPHGGWYLLAVGTEY